MAEIIIEFFKEINVAQLLAIGVMLWLMYSRLDGKIEKLDKKLSDRIDAMGNKVENIDHRLSNLETKFEIMCQKVSELGNKVEDVDRRLCRIEGSLATQGHCLFTQSHQEKKAE